MLGSDDLVPERWRSGTSALVDPLEVLATTSNSTVAVVRDAAGAVLGAPMRDGRRAQPGDGISATVLAELGRTDGMIRAVPGVALPSFELRDAPLGPGVDQTNETVIVDGQVAVKWLARAVPAPHPAVELGAHLTAVGFVDQPAAYGSIEWIGPSGPVVLAVLTGFLDGATDGWEWGCASLERAVRAGRALDLEWPDELGALTGRLQRFLATPSAVLPAPVTNVGAAEIARWRSSAIELMDEAVEVVDRAGGGTLLAHVGEVRAALDALGSIESCALQRIHGDWHVGQVLRWSGGLAATDFDGDPLMPADRVMRSPMRDAVSMAQAIDHVMRVVDRRTDGSYREPLIAWRAAASEQYWQAYRREASVFDARLIAPFAVEQELHEIVYSARHLPRWRYVPEAALPALFGA